jgi:IS5 family transposase
MLRMYLLQVWFNLSDEGTEDAIYDSYAMRKFVGINFLEEDAPDATTLLKFRRLLEQHGINKLFFEAINRVMVESGHMLKGGTVVDATIINASPSTKNAEKQRDPEMHQTKKGNEWRFGMKCHIGVDAFSGLVHTMEVTSANVHDVSVAAKLIREDDEVVYGDSGYLGIDKREEVVSDEHLSSIDYRINRRPSSLQKVSDNSFDWDRMMEHAKSSVRCKVRLANTKTQKMSFDLFGHLVGDCVSPNPRLNKSCDFHYGSNSIFAATAGRRKKRYVSFYCF